MWYENEANDKYFYKNVFKYKKNIIILIYSIMKIIKEIEDYL